MRKFAKYFIMSMLLLLLILPLSAQDVSNNDAALQRIADAATSQATVLNLSNLDLTEIPTEIG
ncbi:MAG: hypothetical protein Q9P44_08400, partial [Anaerolineae bacterium]|nr:hypothetical protein [Anaerolineae bacterium]